MSLPNKQEVVDKAQTLSFAERIKYGAKLGHAQTSNPELGSLLRSVRSYEPPKLPQLDSASVAIAKFLPTQQQSNAKHFDVEQVVLAAATASKDTAMLEAEIRGPGASNLAYACDRLCKLKGKDDASSSYLFDLLVSLPERRRKSFLKSLVKHRHTKVLDQYVQHISGTKNLHEQLLLFLHGCSHAVVVQHFQQLFDNFCNRVLYLHFARYHYKAILEVMERRMAAAFPQNQHTSIWELWNRLNTHGCALELFLRQPGVTQAIVDLMLKYPPKKLIWNEYWNTFPHVVLKYWKLFCERHMQELLTFALGCTYPQSGFRYFTFVLSPDIIKSRSYFMPLLEATIPSKIDTSITEEDQLALPMIFTTCVQKFYSLKSPTEIVKFATELHDWEKRFIPMVPVYKMRPMSISSMIYSSAYNAIETMRCVYIGKLEERRIAALQQLITEGKKPSDLTVDMYGLVDLEPYYVAAEQLFALYKPNLLAALETAKEYNQPDPKHKELRFCTHTFEATEQLLNHLPYTLELCKQILSILNAYSWKNDNLSQRWNNSKERVYQIIWRHFVNSPQPTKYSARQQERFQKASLEGFKMVYEWVKEKPTERLSFIRDYVLVPGPLDWSTYIKPFWDFYLPSYLLDALLSGEESSVKEVLGRVPVQHRQAALQQIFEHKKVTQSQRTELIHMLDISDPKSRKTLEQATFASAPTERIAALIRLVMATAQLPGQMLKSNQSSINSHMQSKESCEQALKQSTETLQFIVKRIKNATFQDRVIFQSLAFSKTDFGLIWLAPGVGPTQFAVWYEMLDDHLQNPNQTMNSIEIEKSSEYGTALSSYGYSEWGCSEPLKLWDLLTERALSCGLMRNDDALVDFAFELAAKVGTVVSGAGDPLGDRIPYTKVANMLVGFRDPVRSNSVIEKLKARVEKYCVAGELKQLKVSAMFRSLLASFPIAHLQYVPALLDFVKDRYNEALASLTPIHISDVNKPFQVPTGFEEEAEKEEMERKQVLTSLISSSPKQAWRVPVLVDFVFNVAMKSWAAKSFEHYAWLIRLQTAFYQHRMAYQGPRFAYQPPKGRALRKFEVKIASAFAREMINISPSALHLPRIQRIVSYSDPSTLFTHLSKETTELDTIPNESERLERMQNAALLGPFTPNLSTESEVARLVSSRGRGRGRGSVRSRGGLVIRRRISRAARIAPVPRHMPGQLLSIETQSLAQLSIVRDIVKKWRRGQSTKSTDNCYFFLPRLCYGMRNWFAAQISTFGDSLYQAILNPMRSLADQKKLLILWTLLPTTSYADILVFLQQNDYNFEPQAEVENEEATPETPEEKPATPIQPQNQLPLAVVEAAIRGTTMNDEPLAPLAFLLSPTFLSSNYSRVAIQAVQALMPFVPGGLLTNALAYLLQEHRKKLKTTAHKQIIRFLSEFVCVEHWDIFLSEWDNPRTHKDVRITLLQCAFQTLQTAQGEVAEKVWQLLSKATKFTASDVVCALLAAQPSQTPKRMVPFILNVPETVLNSRTRNMWPSCAIIPIPIDLAPRYMETVIMPLLTAEDMRDSDLQFLAHVVLQKWSGFMDSNKPGSPDIAAVCQRLLNYMKQSIQSSPLWESENRRECIAARSRVATLFSHFSWLLCMDPQVPRRNEFSTNAIYEPSDYIIANGTEMMTDFMRTLIDACVELNRIAPSPYDEPRLRKFGHLQHLLAGVMEGLAVDAVAKEHLTLDQQTAILAPLRNSIFAFQYEAKFATITLFQLPKTIKSLDKFIDRYQVIVATMTKNPVWRGTLYQSLYNWAFTFDEIAYESKLLGLVLRHVNSKIASKTGLGMERTMDLYCAHNLSKMLLIRTYGGPFDSLMQPYVEFLDYLVRAYSGVIADAPGLTISIPDLASDVNSVIASISDSNYYISSTWRKNFCSWIVKKAIGVFEQYESKASLTVSEREHLRQWRRIFGLLRGSLISWLLPTYTNQILHAAAKEGPIAQLAMDVLQSWLNPNSVIVDPALAGVGTLGVDVNYAVKLMKDLIDVALDPKDTATTNDPQYIQHIIESVRKILSDSSMSKILHSHAPKYFWQGFNMLFAVDYYNANLSSYTLSSVYAACAVTRSIDVAEEEVDTAPLVNLIQDLSNGKFIQHTYHANINKIYPFEPLKEAYMDHCQLTATRLLMEKGQSLTLMLPQSSKRVWRSDLTSAAENLLTTGTVPQRVLFAHSAVDFSTLLVPPPPTPAKAESSAMQVDQKE